MSSIKYILLLALVDIYGSISRTTAAILFPDKGQSATVVRIDRFGPSWTDPSETLTATVNQAAPESDQNSSTRKTDLAGDKLAQQVEMPDLSVVLVRNFNGTKEGSFYHLDREQFDLLKRNLTHIRKQQIQIGRAAVKLWEEYMANRSDAQNSVIIMRKQIGHWDSLSSDYVRNEVNIEGVTYDVLEFMCGRFVNYGYRGRHIWVFGGPHQHCEDNGNTVIFKHKDCLDPLFKL